MTAPKKNDSNDAFPHSPDADRGDRSAASGKAPSSEDENPSPRRRQLLILVTGHAGSGKSRFMEHLAERLEKTHRLGGFIMEGSDRREELRGAAMRYDLRPLGRRRGERHLWADRDGEKCVFRDGTLEIARTLVHEEVSLMPARRPEVMFIDEIGRLELSGKGFAQLFREALDSDVPVLVVALKKKALEAIVAHFGLGDGIILDLDSQNGQDGEKDVLRRIAAMDAARIGAFAGLGGLVEVGLGSTIRALKLPLKGHILAYLQNILLITFGRALNGRGLFRITFITSMLKAFSPMGGTLRPMLYIFLQGGIFALPSAVMGFGFPAAVIGSVLMAWLTLVLKLLLDFLIFGMSFFDAWNGAISRLGDWMSISGLSLWTVIACAFMLKTAVAIAVATAAWFGDMTHLIVKLRSMGKWAPAPKLDLMGNGRAKQEKSCREVPAIREKGRHGTAATPTLTSEWGGDTDPESASGSGIMARGSFWSFAGKALGDIFHWRFALFFFLSVLVMMFFADLGTRDLMALVARGLCISYLGFLLLRCLDFQGLGDALDRKFGLGLGDSLPSAMEVLKGGSENDREEKGASEKCAPQDVVGENAGSEGASLQEG